MGNSASWSYTKLNLVHGQLSKIFALLMRSIKNYGESL
jgi:hypothetical protein